MIAPGAAPATSTADAERKYVLFTNSAIVKRRNGAAAVIASMSDLDLCNIDGISPNDSIFSGWNFGSSGYGSAPVSSLPILGAAPLPQVVNSFPGENQPPTSKWNPDDHFIWECISSKENESFTLIAPKILQKVNVETELFFKTASIPGQEDFKPLNFQVTAVHSSSGHLYDLNMDNLENLCLYRCSFIPQYVGRYCVTLYHQTVEDPSMKALSSLELHIIKDYFADSENPTPQPFDQERIGSKYWGVTTSKITDMFYFTDRGSNEVVALHSASLQPMFRLGQKSAPALPCGNLYRPTGLVCDNIQRRLIVCDKDNHRILFFTLDGQFISSFGKKGHKNGEFNFPWDVDISPSGDLIIVSDSRNHRLQMFDRFGNFLHKYSVFENFPFAYKTEFDYPRGVTFDHEGKNIFVTDFNNNNVMRLDVGLTECERLIPPENLSRPQGITSDDLGNVLVCDSRNDCIRVISPTGDLLSTINQIGTHKLNVPADVTVLKGGNVAAIDIHGHIGIF